MSVFHPKFRSFHSACVAGFVRLRRRPCVAAELDRHPVEEREDVHHDRLPAVAELGQLIREILHLEHGVLDLHRLERPHLEGGLVDDPEQAVARPRGLQQLGILLVHLQDLAGGRDHLHGHAVRVRLPELAGHRRVLGRAARQAADRGVAQLDVHVELESALLQLLGDVDQERTGLGGHCVGADVEDPAHRPHVDDRPAVGHAADGRRVPRAARANR